MELQGPARFAKLHSEIMNVVRGSVDLTCYAGIRTNKKKYIYDFIKIFRSYSDMKTFPIGFQMHQLYPHNGRATEGERKRS